MSTKHPKYCLDANVLIEAWQKYYAPKLCPEYWELLNQLGKEDRIFIPQAVFDEVKKVEDDLADWLKGSNIPKRKLEEPVIESWKKILATNPIHQHLVDSIKGRSLADPWVIAHAFCEGAIVVTKEEKITAVNSDRIKIPNVCENMKIRCVNDFQFIEELNIRFSCRILI
jgi:predicted nucleic acid-binding protein